MRAPLLVVLKLEMQGDTTVFVPVCEANVEQLKLLNSVIFPLRYPQQVYTDCLACGDLSQLAYRDGTLVGAIACRLELQATGNAKLYILTLGVLAPYRSAGIGSCLVQKALEACAEDPQIIEAYCHVQVGNDEATRFYERLGFTQVEVIPNYYSRLDPSDAYVLARPLVGQP